MAVLAVLLGGGVWLGLDRFRADRPPDVKGASDSQVRGETRTSKGRRMVQPRDDAGTHRLEGQVIDASEQPVGGVVVGLDTRPPRVTQTEADGSFVFEDLAERTYRVGASKDDHRADAVAVRVGPAVEPITLRLRRGNAMLVKVQDEDGAPIAGARVFRRGIIVRDQRTGPDGTTLLRGLGSAWERIEITADGYEPGFVGRAMPSITEVPIEHVVTLYPGAAVRGFVRDPDGAPVLGARVSNGNSKPHVTSAADGAWLMPGVRAGTHTFVARADGFAPGSVTREVDGKTRLDGVDIVLGRGLTISGRVVDAEGAPVSGAKVSVAVGYDKFDSWADESGEFELSGLRDGVHELAAFHGDRASMAVDVEAAEQPTNVELVVVDSTIRGTVVDDTGEPVVDAEIWAMRGSIAADLTGEDDAVTDSAGRFVLGPLVVGEYKVNAIYPGGGDRRLLGPMVPAKTGQEDVRIVLPRRGSIHGRLTSGGVPVTSFVVSIDDFHRADYRDASVLARADGSFELENIPPGRYHVAFAGDSFARHIISSVRVEAGEVVGLGAIEVGGGRTIRGRVLVGDREPVEGATVQIGPTREVEGGPIMFGGLPFERELAGVRSARTDANGWFVVEHVSEDVERWEKVGARANHPVHGRSETVVIPPADEPMELVLAGAGTIRGTIRGLRPDDDGTAFIAPARGNGGVVAELDEAGHFEVRQLAPGTYRVMKSRSFPIANVVATAEVRSGETTLVELSFEGHDVSLTVDVGDRGCRFLSVRRPKGGARRDGSFAMTKCDGDGLVRIPGLAPGSFDLCVDSVCKPVTVTESPKQQTHVWR